MIILSILVFVFLSTWGLTCLIYKKALRHQVFEKPKTVSMHKDPKSNIGGIGFGSVVLSSAFLWMRGTAAPVNELFLYIFFGTVLLLVGIFDDVNGIKAIYRLFLQIIISLCFTWVIDHYNLFHMESGGLLTWAYLIFFFGWVIGMINTYNFMDGIDGMASAQAVLAGIGWAGIGFLTHVEWIIVFSLILSVAMFAFACFNWHPAKIFMGDSGSTFLGFTFAILPLYLDLSTPTIGARVSLIAGAMIMWIFIMDPLVTVLKRVYRRENLFSRHYRHLFQRLVLNGKHPHDRVVSVYMAFTIMGIGFAWRWILYPTQTLLITFLLISGICYLSLHNYVWAIERKKGRAKRPLQNGL
ncbi:MAG: hypothetical protein A2Y14_02750 [Verrucomicrobia bacterium GWF2_51_19]|nr:MAG: hypothetical protein A2Y14_02750 [Verrucomicrobia bacterium GWF2_51_19]